MEKKSADKKNDLKEQWILCKSKNRAGRKYLFNTATGESKWCGKDETDTTAIEKPSLKKLRTPAQDRLKRLQKETRLKNSAVEKTEKNTCPTKTTTTETFEKAVQKEVQSDTTQKNLKRKPSQKKSEVQGTEITADSKSEVAEKKIKHNENQSTVKKVLNNIKDFETEVRQKIVKKLGAIRKGSQKYNAEKKPKLNEQPVLQKFTIPKVAKPRETSHTPEPVANNKPHHTFIKPRSSPETNDIADNNKLNIHKVAKTPEAISTYKTVNNEISTPSAVPKGIANQRLAELRQKLQSQLKESSNVAEDIIIKKYNNNEVEPMDWESLDTAAKMPEPRTTNGKYYSTKAINDSLLHFSNEKRGKSKQKWRKNFYYIIPDTNVWLNHLTFLDEISKMKLLDTEGSVLYIPYIVIKELDGLKNRETVELRAKMAINYVHEQLKINNNHVQTQSAFEEKEHIIKVDCPDDSIINCCLQVQRHISNTMLLSEDKNLRNKANCNDVFTTTKSDLLSCH